MKRYGRTTAPARKQPETAAEAAPLIQKYVIKLFDRGTGQAADWAKIADALLVVVFHALDQAKDNPSAMPILRQMHSAAESRLTAHPGFEPELYHPDNSAALLNTYGFDPDPSKTMELE